MEGSREEDLDLPMVAQQEEEACGEGRVGVAPTCLEVQDALVVDHLPKHQEVDEEEGEEVLPPPIAPSGHVIPQDLPPPPSDHGDVLEVPCPNDHADDAHVVLCEVKEEAVVLLDPSDHVLLVAGHVTGDCIQKPLSPHYWFGHHLQAPCLSSPKVSQTGDCSQKTLQFHL